MKDFTSVSSFNRYLKSSNQKNPVLTALRQLTTPNHVNVVKRIRQSNLDGWFYAWR